MTIRIQDVQVQDILFSKLEDSPYITSQKVSFISYKQHRNKLLAQTPEFITETYGIPREGPFYNTIKSRAFYKLPFCHEKRQHVDEVNYDAIEVFYKKLQEIDAYVGSEAFRVELFGEKNAKKYEYQPLVRMPEEDDAPPTGGKIYYRPPYTKVKLDLSYDTDEPRFRLFEKKDDHKTEVKLKTFDDVLQHMRYLTKHRMVIQFARLYAMKNSTGSDKKKYGIILKAFAVECSNKSRRNADVMEEDIFLDMLQ
jgi:hypothetical protein